MKRNLLLVDDDNEALSSLAKALLPQGLDADIYVATTADEAIGLQKKYSPSVAVIDLSLNNKEGVESGFNLLRALLQNDVAMRVVVLTGHSSTEFGVRAITMGAANFLEKPADIKHLAALLQDGYKQAELRRAYVAATSGDTDILERMVIGHSEAIKKVRESIRYAASNNLSVFINGETGTGKGLCANAIHQLSARRSGKFVRFQPSYMNSDLINGDLFGHIKGAFTGATDNKPGLVAEANGGSLFLDEIDELPPESQVMLLGLLQDRKFRKVGSVKEESSDFRLIAASNRNIEECLASGRLRRDLFHRFARYTITLPPLRDRQSDIEAIAEAYLAALRSRDGYSVLGFDPGALWALRNREWLGNVRELEGVVESAVARAQFEGESCVKESHLSLAAPPSGETPGNSFYDKVETYKFRLVQEALVKSDGNQVMAAASLGIDRGTVKKIISKTR
jgi:two-component system response regulator AtoC